MSEEEKIEIGDSFQFSEKVVIKMTPKQNGRYPYEQIVTENALQADGSRKNNTRVIDRKNDRYKEVTTDMDGNITHICDEKLSEHTGHGSAKKKQG